MAIRLVPSDIRHELIDDGITAQIRLTVPAESVALLQALFELHEGIGTVRTEDPRADLICILTPISQLEDCKNMLCDVQNIVTIIPGLDIPGVIA